MCSIWTLFLYLKASWDNYFAIGYIPRFMTRKDIIELSSKYTLLLAAGYYLVTSTVVKYINL